jgi:aspartate racemase
MKRLGVLGGMGPAASAEFINRLIQQTPADRDQDHIPFVLWNNPQIPDRSTSMRNGDDKPLSYLIEGIQALKYTGCDLIVIPCNTAHFWYHELIKLEVPIIHIVDSVAGALRDVNVTNTMIGVIGTQATVEFGLYQYMLTKLGWDSIVPTNEEMDTLVQPAIDLIKGGNIEQAHLLLMTVVKGLIDRGAKAVVLGCTEIPLAIKEVEENGIPIVNSIDSLVKSVLKSLDKQTK